MSVDIEQQLRALGRHLEHDAPEVGIDDVLSRLQSSVPAMRSDDVDAPRRPAAADSSDRSRVSRRSTLVAAAVVAAAGLIGLVVVSNRAITDESNPPSAAPVDPTSETRVAEPAVFPIVGEQAGPMDFGSFSQVGRENPERLNALVARRDGDTLSDALWITATLTRPVDVGPDGTAPAEAVGEQMFEIHDRPAVVWTEPSEIPVQHVRFDGEPVLEVAGVDALAFMQAAGPDAIRTVQTADETGFALEIGDLPDGYDLVVEPFREQLGTITASISVGSTATTEGSYVGVSLTNPLAASAAYSETMSTVDINGRPGWIGSGPGNWVTWEPEPGTFATTGGTSSPDESIALARSVKFVDRATWQSFYKVADPVF
jgi:hypothetical protein